METQILHSLARGVPRAGDLGIIGTPRGIAVPGLFLNEDHQLIFKKLSYEYCKD